MGRSNVPVRRYSIFHKFEDISVADWDKDLSNALNSIFERSAAMGSTLSPTEAFFELLVIGVRQELEGARKESYIARNDDVYTTLNQVREEKKLRRDLAEIYEAKGLDDFVDWCEANGRDWNEFLKDYDLMRPRTYTWSQIALEWLRELLLDGNPVQTDIIKIAAIRDGILDDSSHETLTRDWGKLRQVALRNGMVGGAYGYWQRNI